jgi:YesN/AraC family two-component response regulator
LERVCLNGSVREIPVCFPKTKKTDSKGDGSARDGEEALKKLSEAQQAGAPFALILMDMHMPQKTGSN